MNWKDRLFGAFMILLGLFVVGCLVANIVQEATKPVPVRHIIHETDGFVVERVVTKGHWYLITRTKGGFSADINTTHDEACLCKEGS